MHYFVSLGVAEARLAIFLLAWIWVGIANVFVPAAGFENRFPIGPA